MAKTKKPIFTVGFSLPGDDFYYVEFKSTQTLLDAEIILIEPTLGSPSFGYSDFYNGVPILTHASGNSTDAALSHWKSEIVGAVNAGKLVIVYATKDRSYYRYTGSQSFSGTGRSRVTTNHVTSISSYEAIPNIRRVTPKTGSDVALSKDAQWLAPYWTEFSDYSIYEVEIEGTGLTPILTVGGQRVVGAAVRGKVGTLLYLPPLRWDEEVFERTEVGDDGAERHSGPKKHCSSERGWEPRSETLLRRCVQARLLPRPRGRKHHSTRRKLKRNWNWRCLTRAPRSMRFKENAKPEKQNSRTRARCGVCYMSKADNSKTPFWKP